MASEVKLTEGQLSALHWADGKHSRCWGGKIMGSPPRTTINAMLRRGLLARVGHPDMDLYRTTDLGRAALSTTKGGGDGE